MSGNRRGYGWKASLAVFGGFAILLWLETRCLIPFLSAKSGWEPIGFWLLVAGLLLFLPMLVLSWILLKREGVSGTCSSVRERCRFRAMNRKDWLWTAAALVVVAAASLAMMKGIELLTGPFDSQPPFMRLEPLGPGRWWILFAWLPYWLLNILGEEILWRGVMLPGQEKVFGRNAWRVNGGLWALFHLVFGRQLLVVMLPLLLVLPFVVQRRRNSWIGVILHAVINGPSFIAIALGVM